MKRNITCFVPYENEALSGETVSELKKCALVDRIYLLCAEEEEANRIHIENCTAKAIGTMEQTSALTQISHLAQGNHVLLYTKHTHMRLGYNAIERMADYLSAYDCAMVYADRSERVANELKSHPVCDYQTGSVRDDFDFGPLLLFKGDAFAQAVSALKDTSWQYSALYALRLELSRHATLFHIRENLYSEEQDDTRLSGEKQFDYVNPRNRSVQIEREAVFTHYLKQIGAFLEPVQRKTDLSAEGFEYEASVIIPVRNRVRTIADAIRSALAQETDFPFNVIVIDNHSTDGTTEIINELSDDPRLIHLVPERTDLGIGGCWSVGVNHPKCGRFAVQLDSDDLYSSPRTLQTVINKFYNESCAMVIGSYQMTDFNLQPLPPGVIDHKEWTPENGHNNALRINGLGAPRAFFTPLLREIGIPNTSYGEDYALGLAFSREHTIGRIYDVLYLCRRWEGNSDAALSTEKTNRNNDYKDSLRTREINIRKELNAGFALQQLKALYSKHHRFSVSDFIGLNMETWPLLQKNVNDAKGHLATESGFIKHYLAERKRSTLAQTDKASIERRPCFLCPGNKPEEQMALTVRLGGETFCVRANPYPIIERHLTISSEAHRLQQLTDKVDSQLVGSVLSWMHTTFRDAALPAESPMVLFYNGASCGASAPDHFHFQAGSGEQLPLVHLIQQSDMKTWTETGHAETPDGHRCRSYSVSDYPCCLQVFITDGSFQIAPTLANEFFRSLPLHNGEAEPRFNMLAWYDAKNDRTVRVYIPRRKHRPECYSKEGDEQILTSPGALDMAGHIVTIRETDFLRVNAQLIESILAEVGYPSSCMETENK